MKEVAAPAVLSIENAQVSYGPVVAVDGVTLDIGAAEIVALLGPSGCGKSTLLRAVAGLEPLSAGRIRSGDVDLATVPVYRRGFGLMFQDGVLFGHRTVAGNIGYGMRMAGADRAAVRDRVVELLDLVGLPGYAERRVATLSGGQAQRVALARALAPNPRLLLLDEPLAALDTALREQLLVDLKRILRSTGTPTVFVTHDQDEAFAIADRVAVMDAGRIRQHGTPREVWDHPVDAWLARFVGYTSILDAHGSALVRPLLERPGTPASLVALRPSALRVEAGGSLMGRVRSVVPGPDGSRLDVEIAGWGLVHAVADRTPATESVTLRFDPAGAALLGDSSTHDILPG